VLNCTTCGQENAADARFCNACGAVLDGVSGHEVRKAVTVLFTDVSGSTALGERLDPESFRRVMARYFDVSRQCVERHGGTVEKFIGDAVMAVFGVPAVHEDDALRALRAAAEIREALAALNEELERDYGVALQLRTGVNSGEVVTGTAERLATGDAVNVAARLEQAAGPGEILIGAPTRGLARAAIEVEPVDALSVKGKAEPLQAYRLVRVVEGAPAFERRLDAPLVGRRRELARIRSAFDAAVSERRCRVLTVLGPPGIGKSRLAREAAATLADEAVVLSGRCLPYGDGITYWPLIEIFREAGAEAELEVTLSAGAPEEIFWSARKALERRARQRPLALIVDDIHWAEPTLLDLLEHLLDWTRDAPLLLLCLARPELIDERPVWSRDSITLETLSRADSDQLIAEALVDSDVDGDTRTRIREVAEGNPLFVEQLLAMLLEGGGPEGVPPTIHALLAARLDALTDDELDVLERASVVGLEFEWEALAELSRGRRRPAGALLAALVRKEFIRPHEALEDTFRFRHMLIRDAAYERTPKELRSDLHARFAGWLDGRGEEFDEIVGYHLEQAYRCLADLAPDSERTRSLARRAALRLSASGRRAVDRGDTGAALNLLERAESLAASRDELRLSLLSPLAYVLREKGQLKRADTTLAEAIDLGKATDDQLAVAHATVALSELRLHTGRLSREEVLEEVDRAMHVFSDRIDKAGMARALTLRGKLEFWRGQAAAAYEELDRAARLADEAGERAGEAETLQYVMASMHRGPMPVVEALARFDELRPRAERNRRLEVVLLETRAHLEAMQMRFDAARDLIAASKALTEEYGLEGLLDSHTRPSAGFVELLAGDAVAAESELRTACEGTERIGELGFLSSITPMLVDALLMQGRDDEALSLTDRWRPEQLTVPEDADAHAGWRRVRAKALARRGDLPDAERLARTAVAIMSATDYLDAHAISVADLGEVLRLAGRRQESASVLEEAIRLHEAKGNVAAAARLRGLPAETPGHASADKGS
jgi:class 3 adenylate cyclase/tetratricopeptide (TPR) repeat protein